jgi:uncharacterized protein (DUF1919 family)
MRYSASIIIPVYNAEKHLRRCVESLALGQERNIEIILIEDCSQDASWSICLELEEEFPNVSAFRNKRNSGVSFTRNHGLAHAQGEYILFVDSDDWVSEHYAKKLLMLAKQYPEHLPICGLHFIDNVHVTRREYIWGSGDSRVVEVKSPNLFELVDRFLLQQLWNKVFRRGLIEKYRIRFDESQNMGEDFQFVLDYMEATKFTDCIVLNEPLYYYIRWNNASLMSNFGPQNRSKAIERYAKLGLLCGESIETRTRYELEVEKLRNNYIYHIVRNKTMVAADKLTAIVEIVGSQKAQKLYQKQKRIVIKEKIVNAIRMLRQLPSRAKGKWERDFRSLRIARIRKKLHNHNFTIISQNCIGGVFYHDMQQKFASPTINLYIQQPDFIRFVMNLKYYMSCELEMRWGEEYPIGVLDDIRVDFMHYDTCQDAKLAWDRRKKRINYKNIVVISTDRNEFDEGTFSEWRRIPYPKVLFTANSRFGLERDSVFYPQYESQGCVPDLIPGREFYRGGILLATINLLGGADQ